ncbi:MAG: DUF6504 family protein [Chloroflexi bacterium]|nr:DUF6504 family protein [Chloroflexota bacterium]
MTHKPVRFIDEPIEVAFDRPTLLEKTPNCPDSIIWEGKVFRVSEMLASWVDYQRRGRMRRNMQPQHAEVAAQRGRGGVGRFFFQVRVNTGQIFEIYYDRSPKDVDDRKGAWVLVSEWGEG